MVISVERYLLAIRSAGNYNTVRYSSMCGYGFSMNNIDVGLIGLGNLGMAVARNLIDRGLSVSGYRRGDAHEFKALGGNLLSSAADVFRSAPIVITCLTDHVALQEIIAGPTGFSSSGVSGRIIVDLSTTALAPRFVLERLVREAGSVMVDCPVSGLPAAVEARTAVLLASCDQADFEAIGATLGAITNEVHYVGAFGAGTRLKYISNFLMVINAAAAAQAISLAAASGLDPSMAVKLLGLGAGGSFQLQSRGPKMALRAYDRPRATLDALNGDLKEIESFISTMGAGSAMFDDAVSMVQEAREMGFGNCDPTALIEPALASRHKLINDQQADRLIVQSD
jgi:L-threonate 2-dehydrogenase